MKKTKKRNITRRLTISYYVLVSTFLAFGISSLYDVNTISSLTRTIYDHPLVVSNAALQANVSITKMHRNMKDIVLFQDPLQIQSSIDAVNLEEQKVFQDFEIVKNTIIGDDGKKLENGARILFTNWKPIREQVINLVQRGDRKKAAEITIGIGAKHVVELEKKMLSLTNYARNKATLFMGEAEKTHSRLKLSSMIFLVLLLSLSSLIAFFVLRQTVMSENKIQQSEKRYRSLIESQTDLVCRFLPDGKFVYVNDVYYKLFNKSKEDLIDECWPPRLVDNDTEIIKSKLSELSFSKPTVTTENRVFSGKGEIRWVQFVNTGIFDGNGKLMEIQSVGRDITQLKRVEEKLRKNEQLMEEAQALAHVGSWEWDIQTGEVDWSNEVYNIFGLDPVHFKPQIDVVMRRFHPEEQKKHQETIAFLKDNRGKFTFEARILLPNHSVRQVIYASRGQYDHQGRLTKIIGSVHDINERKEAEKTLNEVLEFNKKIISESPVGIAIYDAESGQCITANESIGKLVGAAKDQVLLQNCYSLDSWKKSGLLNTAKTALAEGVNKRCTAEVKTTFGKDLAIDCHFAPFTFGAKRHLLVAAADISRRIKAEKAIVEQKRVAERYLNLACVIFVGLDSNGIVNVANQKAYDILECREKDVIGKNWFDHFIPPNLKQDVHSVFLKLMRGEIELAEYHENPILSKSGKEKLIAWHNTYLADDDGKIVGILAAGEDITEKKQLQVQLQQSQKLESIGNLAGGIAHDFNNILSSIIGYTELAFDEVAKGIPLEGYLQEIYTAGTRARDLVKQILAFARQSDEKRKPIRIDSIAKEVLKLIRSTIPSSIEIRESINSQSLILGNPSHVHQLLLNLCTNASQAMEETGGILEIGLEDVEYDDSPGHALPKMKSDNYIKITVSDTGMGIAPNIIDSIFEPYFTTKGVGKGTGMGLALVHGIVESYGGTISVKSELGKGTIFSVFLLVTKKHEDYLPYKEETLPSGSERILFVDDEASIAKIGGKVLERLGYSVTTRTNSVEALDLFQSKPGHFDLIITDMTMPKMTGEKLAAELMKTRANIPVILCTGYSNMISDEEATKMGIKAFAYKPFVKADLAKTVRKVLDDTKG